MRVHVIACARSFERARRPMHSAFRGEGVANLTLPYLAALIAPHHEVVIQDERVAPLVLSNNIDLALITLKSCFAPRAYEIADRLRAMGVPVVMGGCHVSLNVDEALAHADAVVKGETENLMEDVLADADAGRLLPVYHGSPADLVHLPVPRRDLLQKRYILDAIIASRGCNYSCRFCCIRNVYGHGFRARPIGEVVDEARQLGPYLGFHDENLVGDLAYGRALFQALRPLCKTWFAQVSADIIKEPDLIGLAAQAGARGLMIGFESVHEENLRAAGKGQNAVDAYREIIAICHHYGILVAPGIVFGFDHDTVETFAETLGFLREAEADICLFKILTPYPGTELFAGLDAEGRIGHTDWSYFDGHFPNFFPRKMTIRQLFEGMKWIRGEFYSKRSILGRLTRNRKLKVPLWVSLNMNRLVRNAYQHANRLGEDLVRSLERRQPLLGVAQEERP